MSIHRGPDGSGPLRPRPIQEERRIRHAEVLTVGTLACPGCDAPVAPSGPVAPRDGLRCPFCAHAGTVRDFLSLEPPTRPARVVVRVSAPSRAPARR